MGQPGRSIAGLEQHEAFGWRRRADPLQEPRGLGDRPGLACFQKLDVHGPALAIRRTARNRKATTPTICLASNRGNRMIAVEKSTSAVMWITGRRRRGRV